MIIVYLHVRVLQKLVILVLNNELHVLSIGGDGEVVTDSLDPLA